VFGICPVQRTVFLSRRKAGGDGCDVNVKAIVLRIFVNRKLGRVIMVNLGPYLFPKNRDLDKQAS
jgi:hypothetical protein